MSDSVLFAKIRAISAGISKMLGNSLSLDRAVPATTRMSTSSATAGTTAADTCRGTEVKGS